MRKEGGRERKRFEVGLNIKREEEEKEEEE